MKVYATAKVQIELNDNEMSNLLFKKALELSGYLLLGDSYHLKDYSVRKKEIDGEEKEVITHISRGYGPYDDDITIVSTDETAVMCLKLAHQFYAKDRDSKK